MTESEKPKNDLYGPVVEALCKMTFFAYGFGPYYCFNTLETHHAAKKILDEIIKDPHKYLPDECFGPSLKDTLEMVANIKAKQKEIDSLQAELDRQDSEFDEVQFEWIKALHEEVTQRLEAEDQVKRHETSIELLKKDLNAALDSRDEYRKKYERADDYSVEIMRRLCTAAGVDWHSLLREEPSIEDMEQAIKDEIERERKYTGNAEVEIVKLRKERDEAVRIADKMRPELAHLRGFNIEKIIKECNDAVASNRSLANELWRVLQDHGVGAPQ